MLPYMSDKRIMRPSVQTGFGGLNHNLSAGEGEIWAMENLSSREYPLLTQRLRRGLEQTISDPGGLGAKDEPWWVSGTGFYYGGVRKGTVTAGEKSFAAMGSKVIIFPDKKYYDSAADEFAELGSERSVSGLRFQNGSYAGVAADANTLFLAGAAWGTDFSAGDAVTISGCVTHPENNGSFIIREVDGDELRFYENSFTLDSLWRYTVGEEGLAAGTYHFAEGGQFSLTGSLSEGDSLSWDGETLTVLAGSQSSTIPVTSGSEGEALLFAELPVAYTESGTVTLRREVPDLDFICVNENRLWGCKGDGIYASKLGDPSNFNVFDGLATDSWQSGVVDAGDFTACVSYLGYPIFFKEDAVYKVYGDKPSNFQWTPSARLGVKRGCHRSLAVAGETLYYLSRAGVAAYTGGIPALISEALGANAVWSDGTGGSDALRYYISMTDGEGYSLFVYDTRCRVWHREDAAQAVGFAFWEGGLHMLTADGKLWRLDGAAGTAESSLAWSAEFADMTRFYETADTASQAKKGLLRLLLRCSLADGSSITAWVQYDSDGTWHEIGTVTGSAAKKSYVLPLILRRCDHFRLKLTGTGESIIYSLTEVRYSGSSFQGGNVSLPTGD